MNFLPRKALETDIFLANYNLVDRSVIQVDYLEAADCTELDLKSWKKDLVFASALGALSLAIQMYSFGSLLYMVWSIPCDLCSAIIQLTTI
jgi:hypothetical protein